MIVLSYRSKGHDWWSLWGCKLLGEVGDDYFGGRGGEKINHITGIARAARTSQACLKKEITSFFYTLDSVAMKIYLK